MKYISIIVCITINVKCLDVRCEAVSASVDVVCGPMQTHTTKSRNSKCSRMCHHLVAIPTRIGSVAMEKLKMLNEK